MSASLFLANQLTDDAIWDEDDYPEATQIIRKKNTSTGIFYLVEHRDIQEATWVSVAEAEEYIPRTMIEDFETKEEEKKKKKQTTSNNINNNNNTTNNNHENNNAYNNYFRISARHAPPVSRSTKSVKTKKKPASSATATTQLACSKQEPKAVIPPVEELYISIPEAQVVDVAETQNPRQRTAKEFSPVPRLEELALASIVQNLIYFEEGLGEFPISYRAKIFQAAVSVGLVDTIRLEKLLDLDQTYLDLSVVPHCVTNWTSECIARKCPNLKSLNLSFSSISVEGLDQINRHCPLLENLALKDCPQLKGFPLDNLKKLKTLNVERTSWNMGQPNFPPVVLPNISELNISGLLVHASTLFDLLRSPSLTKLWANNVGRPSGSAQNYEDPKDWDTVLKHSNLVLLQMANTSIFTQPENRNLFRRILRHSRVAQNLTSLATNLSELPKSYPNLTHLTCSGGEKNVETLELDLPNVEELDLEHEIKLSPNMKKLKSLALSQGKNRRYQWSVSSFDWIWNQHHLTRFTATWVVLNSEHLYHIFCNPLREVSLKQVKTKGEKDLQIDFTRVAFCQTLRELTINNCEIFFPPIFHLLRRASHLTTFKLNQGLKSEEELSIICETLAKKPLLREVSLGNIPDITPEFMARLSFPTVTRLRLEYLPCPGGLIIGLRDQFPRLQSMSLCGTSHLPTSEELFTLTAKSAPYLAHFSLSCFTGFSKNISFTYLKDFTRLRSFSISHCMPFYYNVSQKDMPVNCCLDRIACPSNIPEGLIH